MTTVLCNGVFDILHIGHLEHLREASALGDYLIVSLTLDAFVNKGPHRPINTWADRASVLRELRCVKQVIPSRTLAEAIVSLRPNIVVKGSDYEGHTFGPHILKALEETGAQLIITRSAKRSVSDLILKTKDLYVRENGAIAPSER